MAFVKKLIDNLEVLKDELELKRSEQSASQEAFTNLLAENEKGIKKTLKTWEKKKNNQLLRPMYTDLLYYGPSNKKKKYSSIEELVSDISLHELVIQFFIFQ